MSGRQSQLTFIIRGSGLGPLLARTIPYLFGVFLLLTRVPTSKFTTSTSWTSLSWSLSITPKFATSLILVQFQGLGQQVNTAKALSCITVYKNGTTNLGHSNLGLSCVGDVGSGGGVYVTASNSFAVFDAPNTTSSVSYELWGKSGTAGTAYPIHGSCRNTFILMEISA